MINSNETEPEAEFLDLVNSAAQTAYRKATERKNIGQKPADMAMLDFCTVVCEVMGSELDLLGIKYETVESPGIGRVTHHDYLKIEHNGKIYRVDPTWKQFIGVDDVDIAQTPDVLISEADEDGNFKTPDFVPEGLKDIYD